MTVKILNRAAAAAIVLGAFVGASVAADGGATPDKYMELLRSDVRSARVEILTEALDLNEAQSAAFWPVYREYDTEMSALGDRRVAMIKSFAAKYGTMTDVDADTFVKEWFTIHKDRIKIREKYHGRVAKVTSGLIAARFLQVDYAIATLIDLQLAAEAPLIE